MRRAQLSVTLGLMTDLLPHRSRPSNSSRCGIRPRASALLEFFGGGSLRITRWSSHIWTPRLSVLSEPDAIRNLSQ